MIEQVEGQLTLFLEGFRASRFPLPGSSEARSGRKWLGLSKSSGQLGLLEKMLLESLEWHSPIFYLNWKPVDIGQGHFLFQLALSEPDTGDTGVAIVGYSEYNGLSSAAVTGGTQKTGRGQQEGKKKAGEFTGTGKSRNSKVVADTKSQTKGRLPIRKKTEQPGFVGSSEDVQHADSAGCEKQHVATESDEERFASWGCYEGNVCDATSEGLSNRSGKSVGGQGTQEQESKRPDSNVSDSDNRSRDVRRDGEFPTIKETERAGSNIGGRAQKHEPGERRTAESVLGGVVDGLPAWMDRDLDFLINHYWDDEPDIPRIATGIEHRVDRLKCLGNAVVPQQFYPIFKAIANLN